ncbi:MAG: class IV adenylate cyclase [Epsilonproteobacteria bacterium]|nr:class IV adenylate cyclase [Campylobacterota bacterium]
MKKSVFIGVILLTLGLGLSVVEAAKEIEIKFQLSKKDEALFVVWLECNNELYEQQKQIENYLNNPDESFFEESKYGYIDALTALRVRETDSGSWLCMKKGNVDPVTGHTLSKDEHETLIEDPQETILIFEKLGYTEKILVKKDRQIYKYSDFEVIIDDVEGLGRFFEVELKNGCQDAAEGLAKIKLFLKSVGLKSIKQFERSYIHMFKNPGYDFSHEVIL